MIKTEQANPQPLRLNICILLTPMISTSTLKNISEIESKFIESDYDIEQTLKKLNHNVEVEYLSQERPMAMHQIKSREKRTDVFVNLNESNNYGVDQALINYMVGKGIPFTGPRNFSNMSRQTMKKICSLNNIPTSPHIFVHDYEDLKKYQEVGQFPLFVKPEDGQGSICISQKSIVRNEQQLRQRVEYVWSKYGGALIQKFIQGEQFTVLVAGNQESCQSFRALRHIFDNNRNVVSFQDKFGTNYKPAWQKVADENLDSQLQNLAKKFYICADLDGYVRFDFRQDKLTKKLYLIDPNPYCCLFVAGDNCSADMAIRQSGWSKEKFISFLIEQAFKRGSKVRKNK